MWQQRTRIGFSCIVVGLVFVLTLLSTSAVHAQSAGGDTPTTAVFLPLISNTSGPMEQNQEPDDYMIIEGDIQVPMDFYEQEARGVDGTYKTNLWTNGIVPYEFDTNVTLANQAVAVAAMNLWQQAANVTFQQCAGNRCLSFQTPNYVHIQASNVNNSAIGMVGGRQVINIASWNNQFIIAHEFAHALGFWHEQSRSDRDQFIQVNTQNVCKATDSSCIGGFCFNGAGNRVDCDFNFNIRDSGGEYGNYDFDSVMHYSRNAFSRNGSDTITVRAPDQAWQSRIGQTNHLSDMDQLTMSFLYPQPTWRFVSNIYIGPSTGTFLSPAFNFALGAALTPAGGTLWVIEPGTYAAVGTYSKPMTIRAGYRPVVLK